MQYNRIEITGVIGEVRELVRSPGGVPHSRFTIDHQSVQIEAGHERKCECRVSAQLSGEEFTHARAKLKVGAKVHLAGFLTKNSFRDDPAWTKLQVTQIKYLD